jgi:PAS domain S-box-containing protein
MASRRSRSGSSAAEALLGKSVALPLSSEERTPRVSGAHYRVLFERAPLPYVVTDFDGTIRAANRAAAVLLKRPSELLEGRSLAAFVPLDHRAEFREMLSALPLLDRLRDWRTPLVPYAGAPVDVALHASVLDGAWEGREAIFWIVRPRQRRTSE